MESIFFLVLVAVVGLLRWLSQAVENKRNAEAEKQSGPPAAAVPSARRAPESEEERVRKFFEALGVPAAEAPPPKVPPRPAAPQPARADRKFMPVDAFPVPRGRSNVPPVVVAAPPPLPVETAPAEKVTRKTKPAVVVGNVPPIRLPRTMLSSAFEVQELGADEEAEATSAMTSSLISRLGTSQGLRDAIVLREIFGPPRSLQPLAGNTVR